ncbi:MAG: universal stress protein [Micromonosporaceae bacterium]
MSGIVVGVDGSQHAQRALEWAMSEAAIRNAPLTVVTVHQVAIDHWGLAELHYPEDVPARQRALDAAQQAVDKVTAQLSGAKPPAVHVKAVNGIPAEVLVSESKDADLLVVGTRGGFEKHMLGSVSTKVAHRAVCPVVIVPSEGH